MIFQRVKHPDSYHPMVLLDTTSRCNYRCKMCFYSIPEVAKQLNADDRTMSMEFFSTALEGSLKYASSISLAGSGEFLTDPLLKERLALLTSKLAKRPDVRFFPVTNGSLLNREKIQMLKGIHKVGFTVSIDTVDHFVYPTIRKPGKLSNVMDNIRNLRANLAEIGITDVHLQLNMVIMKRNVFTLPKVIQFAHEVHAKLFVDHPQGVGPKSIAPESLFNVPVFTNAFIGKCKQLADSLMVPIDFPSPFAVTEKEIDSYYAAKNGKTGECKLLNEGGPLVLRSDGNVEVCCQPLVFGNLLESSFDKIYNSPKFDEYRNAISEGNPLSPCDHCRWLQRKSPYLHESEDYDLDIPFEDRDFSPNPNFQRHGFANWVDDLEIKQARSLLASRYIETGVESYKLGLTKKISSLKNEKKRNVFLSTLISEKKRIVIYPAGQDAKWFFENTILSETNIVAFADSNTSMHGSKLFEHPIISPEELYVRDYDMLLIVSTLYGDEIYSKFKELSSKDIDVIKLDSEKYTSA